MKKIIFVLPVALALCACDKKPQQQFDLMCGDFRVEATMHDDYVDMKITRIGESVDDSSYIIDSILSEQGDTLQIPVRFFSTLTFDEQPDIPPANVYEHKGLGISFTLISNPSAKLQIKPVWEQRTAVTDVQNCELTDNATSCKTGNYSKQTAQCVPYRFVDNQEK